MKGEQLWLKYVHLCVCVRVHARVYAYMRVFMHVRLGGM